MARDPYKIMIVGASGRGKTMSFENMNPETCGFINLDNKPLPFLNNFKYYCTPNNWQEAYQKLIEYANNEEITEVVFESFSSYVNSLLKTARETKVNWDVWNMYNDEIGKLLYVLKKYPKELITTAHYEWIETSSGGVEKRVKVKGKEWEGLIEMEFTLVLFAEVHFLDGKRKYNLVFNSDGKSSAKTPPMFLDDSEEIIDNRSLPLFLQRIRDVVNKKTK